MKYGRFNLLIRILIVLFFVILVFDFIPKKKKTVYIPKNVSAKYIGKLLEDNKLILSKSIFRWAVYLTMTERKIKEGNYDLYFSVTTLPIVYKLVKGAEIVKVTIPEGFTVEQISQRLYSKGVISDPIEFITYVKSKNLEGFLFPETYYFYKNQSVEEVVNKMVKEFYKKYIPEFAQRAYELKMSTYQVVILASIIEKEAKSFEEKKLVSAVFHNRLKKGWNLESCATVRYALKKYKEPLTYKDLEVNSKYNTYKYPGLPPSPICNPGLDSIKAAIYPKETDDLFFFTPDNNTLVFSKYYKQHLEKQKKMKK
jgi:UPF0755 protein